MRKKQSLAAHLHVAWLVNLAAVGFVVFMVWAWLAQGARAANIYGEPTPQPVVIVQSSPWIGTFPTPPVTPTPARQESPLPYVALGGALVLGAVLVLRLTESDRRSRVRGGQSAR